jgi:hypothetical protein
VKSPPRALGPWALDSGGFTELSLYGDWQTTPAEYVAEVRRWRDEVGQLRWAAIQDWMCEPFILEKTGGCVASHQRRTVQSYLELSALAPELPWLPVVQGWGPADYLRHADQYGRVGVDLASLPAVGLGSVCRRQHTEGAEDIIRELHGRGIKPHAFGFKLSGLRRSARYLASADSMAWSFDARRSPPLPGCRHGEGGRGSCANCLRYALWWRGKALRAAACSAEAEQGVLYP